MRIWRESKLEKIRQRKSDNLKCTKATNIYLDQNLLTQTS